MTYYYDLHIHSVLSPCADCLMTPNNIFNMAMIKGLDIIAVTDHNSMKQLLVCNELAKSYDLLFVPGVEITVSEGFDVIVYFKSIEDILVIDKLLEAYLPKRPNNDAYYGHQEIMDIYDTVITHYPYLLIQPLNLSFNHLLDILKSYETIIIFPHLERQPHCIHKYLDEQKINAVESCNKQIKTNIKVLHNSDAHQITDILERTEKNDMELEDLSIQSFFNYFIDD